MPKPLIMPGSYGATKRPLSLVNRWGRAIFFGFIGLAIAKAGDSGRLDPGPVARRGNLFVLLTPHYIVETDISPAMTREVADHMETVWRAYHEIMKPFGGRILSRFVVRVYEKQEDYLQEVGHAYKNTNGIYISEKHLLIACVGRADKEKIFSVLRHEGFHQFMHHFISGTVAPWANEGLARLFEYARVSDGTLLQGEIYPAPLRQAQAAIRMNQHIPLSELLRYSHADWHANVLRDASHASLQYAQSWLFIHFLLYAENGRHQRHLYEYLKLIDRHVNHAQAQKQVFGTNYQRIEAMWREYVLSLEPSPRLLCRENMELIAMLYRQAGMEKQCAAEEFAQGLLAGNKKDIYVTFQGRAVRGDDREAIRSVFRCPADKNISSPTSYRFEFPALNAPAPTIICEHHSGFRLKLCTRYNALEEQWEQHLEEEPRAGGS